MDLADLAAFVSVAESLNFRRAAAASSFPQSTLSRRVQRLEDELGVSLFERHRSGVRLTRAGREFLQTTRGAIAELDYAARRAANAGKGASGHLCIGIFASIASGFPRDVIRAFSANHPDVAIDIAEGAPHAQTGSIQERRMDVSFITGETQIRGLEIEHFWTEQVALVMPDGHPLATAEDLSWPRLREERFIVSRQQPGPEIHEWLIKRLSTLSVRADIARYDVGRETLLVLVGLGFGLTVVSEAATGAAYPGVVYRLLEREEDRLPFLAVWSAENDNPALRRFLALMRAMSRGNPLPPAA